MPMVADSDLSRINMEDCMLAHATLWTGEPNDLDYLCSKYGSYNRHKHLRTTNDTQLKYLYAGLDADTTLNHVWRGLLREFKRDTLSYKEYKLRRQPLLHVINRFNSRGVKVYQDRVTFISKILDSEMARIEQRAKELTGNPHFSISSHSQVSQALYGGQMFTDGETRKYRERADKAKVVKPKRALKAPKGSDATQELINQLKLQLGVE